MSQSLRDVPAAGVPGHPVPAQSVPGHSRHDLHPRAGDAPGHNPPTPSIADRFADLLAPLPDRRRRGLIGRLSVGYYEGWRPSRAEVAELVAQELRRSPR